jgi:hypothetical protein
MMSDDRDPLLQTLFADARNDLDGEAFTAQVMAKTRFLRYRVVAPWVCIALMLAAGASYLAIPLEIAQLIAQGLTTTLIDLGGGWLGWVFSPVNNIAALLVLIVKAIRVGRNRILGAPHGSW